MSSMVDETIRGICPVLEFVAVFASLILAGAEDTDALDLAHVSFCVVCLSIVSVRVKGCAEG